jgi:CRP/FNR family transcriptional regulator, polysaccharide utilization system transcription regulator
MSDLLDFCSRCLDDPKSVFSVLTKEEKEFLRGKVTCAKYSKGEYIFKEGDQPTGLIYLSEGKVKIFKEGVGGREQIVRMAKPIGFIGYRALFAEEHHIASAMALEESITCNIPKEALFTVLKNNSNLALGIMKAFATELGFSNMKTITLTQKHIRGRLAEALLFLRDTYGVDSDNMTLKICLSREDLAQLSNMTTSNAIRTLSSFANENILVLHGRQIKILDFDKLEKINEMG